MNRKYLSLILIVIFLFVASADVKSAKGSIGGSNSINRNIIDSTNPKSLEYTEKMTYVKEKILEFNERGTHVEHFVGDNDEEYDGDIVYDIIDYMETMEKENPDVLNKSDKAQIDEYMNGMIDNMQRSGYSKDEIHNMVVDDVQKMAEKVLLGKGKQAMVPEKIERLIKTGSVQTDKLIPVTRDQSPNSKVVSTLKNNDNIIIVEEKDDSFYIQDSNGRRGFAQKIGINTKMESSERFSDNILSTIPFNGRIPLFEEKVLPEIEISSSLEQIGRNSVNSDNFVGSSKNQQLLEKRIKNYIELEAIRNDFEKQLKDKSLTEILASKPGIKSQLRSREIQSELKEIDTAINTEIKNNTIDTSKDIAEFILKRCNKGSLPGLSNIVNNAKETLAKKQNMTDHDSSSSISSGGRGLLDGIKSILNILSKVSKVIEKVVSFLKDDSIAQEYFAMFLNSTSLGNTASLAGLDSGSSGGSSGGATSEFAALTSGGDTKSGSGDVAASGGAARIVRSALGAVNKRDVIYGVDCYNSDTSHGKLACAAVVSAILKNANVGFNTYIIYCPTMVSHLGSHGFSTVQAGNYAAGDVCFWTKRRGDRPRHVGVIVEKDAYGKWWAVDNSTSSLRVLKRPLVRSYYPIILPGKRVRN
ncbi:MAG: hypothetical protein M0R46_00175 [Candidatus Muirbacterium halophilum]|nr:hypothetical protein [Candidatus Muirbacterium halophilum]MCK9474308.1 hypothetical protein [Candidatus Muirbacterium halophilum]